MVLLAADSIVCHARDGAEVALQLMVGVKGLLVGVAHLPHMEVLW